RLLQFNRYRILAGRLVMTNTDGGRRQRRLVLAVMVLSLMMVVSATSGLNIALPDLARATGASQTQVQWIVDVYALIFAGLLLSASGWGAPVAEPCSACSPPACCCSGSRGARSSRST